jgi:integral membrane sensor domain MASE1
MSRVLALAVACLAGAEFGALFSSSGVGWDLPAIWPPVGILVAVLVATERRQWPLLVLAASVAVLLSKIALHGQPWVPSIGFCLLFGLEACAAAWLLRRAIDGPFTLARVAHVWTLTVVALVVPMIVGLIAALMQQPTDAARFLPAWRAWWFTGSLGVLLTAPLAFAWMNGPRAFVDTSARWRVAEAAVGFCGALVLSQMVYGEGLPPILRVPAYILPFFLWGAFRLEPGGAVAITFGACMIGLWNTAGGIGPFPLIDSPSGEWILRSQGAVGAISLSILLLSSVVAERNYVARERARLLAELQKALAEIKTLCGLIPICAWCHKVRDDAGFWQGIEAYLHAHTEATFSHSICPGCRNDMQQQLKVDDQMSTSPP